MDNGKTIHIRCGGDKKWKDNKDGTKSCVPKGGRDTGGNTSSGGSYPSGKDGHNRGNRKDEEKKQGELGGSNNKKPTTQTFEHDFDVTGVMNYAGHYSSKAVGELAHLVNLRGTMQPGWGHSVFAKVKILNLSHNNLTGSELSPLFQSMYYQKMDIDVLDLGYNKMCSNSVGELLWSIGNAKDKHQHDITTLKLNRDVA
jgi:hypothetical protein